MPAKKTEETVLSNTKPIELKGVYAKLQAVRVALYDANLKKSGKNDFAHFQFFQLKDFLPTAEKLFTKIGLYSHFDIMPKVVSNEETLAPDGTKSYKPIIKEVATLVIRDIETGEFDTYEMEVAPVVIGNNTKQNIYQAAGGRSTYYKRYLYRDALEIEEDDESDAVLGAENVNYQEPAPTTTAMGVPMGYAEIPVQQPVQPVTIQQDIVTSAPVMEQPVVQAQPQVTPQPVITNSDALLTQESRTELAQLMTAKNLNMLEVLSNYCVMASIVSPAEIRERDKANLIDYINSL